MSITFTKKYKETDFAEKYNIVSVSAFIADNPYKTTIKYYTGLKIFIKHFKKIFPGFMLRIYYDDSITTLLHDDIVNKEVTNKWIPLWNKLTALAYIQLVHYSCPAFKNGKLHDGVFGSVVRFYPIFDFNDNKNLNMVIVSDIDVTYGHILKIADGISYMKRRNTLVHYSSNTCYTSTQRFDIFSTQYVEKHPYAMLPNKIITRVKFPKNIFKNFFDCMQHLDNPVCSILRNFIHNERNNMKKAMNLNNNSDFVYGIDEYILYQYIYEYIVKKQIATSINISLSITKMLWAWYTKNIYSDYAEYVVKMLMKEDYDNSKTPSENYLKFDKVIYSNNCGDLCFKYNANAISLIKKLSKHNNYEKYGFKQRDIFCVMNVVRLTNKTEGDDINMVIIKPSK